ncbi:cytochrome P450 [Mycolicibacterium thermoresistibile]
MTEMLEKRGRTDGWDRLQYDHRDSRIVVAPHDLWRRLREQCPAIHSDRYGGFWFVSRYDDVKTVLTDCETFTATEGINIPRQNMALLPGEVDPPIHREYRRILNPPLAPQVVKQHEGWIRELAREWVGKIAEKGRFDLCSDYCEPYAKRVSLRVIGYEPEDLDKLDHWTGTLAAGVRDDEEGIRLSMEFFAHLADTLQRRATEEPRADIISAIVSGEIDGRPLTLEEQQSILLQTTFGGLHTSGAVMAGALVWLAGHPEDRARLEREPELMPKAVEEFIRYVTPVPHMNRAAAKDTTLGGCPIAKGERVMFGLGSANHDETVFDNPDEVILDRFPNRHLGFGAGPHRCVGSHLGKLTARIGLEEFLAAFSDFEVTDYYALRYNGGEGRGLMAAPMTATKR